MLHSSFDMKDMGVADVILVLEGYCDANWISNHNEGKSTSGYVFTLEGDDVSSKSCKQVVNTRSTMEANFVPLDKDVEEAEWLRYLLEDSKPTDPYVVDGRDVPTEAQVTDYESAASQWNHNEYNCRKFILNALDDSPYDIYSTFATARKIWELLEKKYRTQVACSKIFVVGKFLNFMMNDAKPVLYLKHLTIDISFEPLVLNIRVEEDNMMNEKADANSIEPNVNMVGGSSSESKSNHKNKGKNVYHCWVCGKPGHKAKDCRHKKEHGGRNSRGNSNQANHVESLKEFVRVIESFLTTNFVDWWFDTGATKHISNSRRMIVSYQKVNEPEPMFMENTTASKIEGKGKVVLKLISGNDLVLSNVLHMPNITKNMISGPILSNKGF
ncbi:DNA polymerase zeta catalytic subunit-like protein [Tanacetum coccineum]|uniref:DNA polymerase zeta catalytic subunit-like protein n=1 Tax=Tanacetum coccineum TaxID=301880 RepID=A0ABQ5GM07_9ASTR